MQALCLGANFPNRVQRIIGLCCTGRTSPATVALRRVQRSAILSDPEYKNGYYFPGPGPVNGLGVARELGTLCYRSRDEFNKRFDWNPEPPFSPQHLTFEVEKYLAAHAARFNTHYDANCYLLLSRCMDLMDLGRGFPNFAEGVKRITAKTYLIGFEKDMLIPIQETEQLAYLMGAHGNEVLFESHPSIFGHDSFLKEYAWMSPRIRNFLEDKEVENGK